MPRKVIKDEGKPVLELYPPNITISIIPEGVSPRKNLNKTFIISKKETFGTIFAYLSKVYGEGLSNKCLKIHRNGRWVQVD